MVVVRIDQEIRIELDRIVNRSSLATTAVVDHRHVHRTFGVLRAEGGRVCSTENLVAGSCDGVSGFEVKALVLGGDRIHNRE